MYLQHIYLIVNTEKNKISRKIKTSAGQYTINQEGLKSIEIILPPIVIQYSFAEFVKQINKLKFA